MGSGSEDVSSGDQTKVDDTHDGTSPMPGTPLQSGDSESSEEEEEQEGVISDSTRAAKSLDEDKPAATSTSRFSRVAPLSLTPLLVKHSEKIRCSKHRADAHQLDTHLKSFQAGLGDQDKAAWAKRETMKCSKKHKDLLVTPLAYMKARKVFKPLASSAYGLCHLYDIGLKATKGLVPISCPMPKAPMTSSQLKALCKGRRQGCPLLIMAVAGEVVTLHGLLSELHMPGALQRLLVKCKDDPADQQRMKTSFCPFCSYHCHNDSTFLNHIVSFHYNTGYSCGNCVEVFITSQSFKVYFKECDGLSCNSTDVGGSPHHSPRGPAKDESPCKRQEQLSKKVSVKGAEYTPAGASKHKKKKTQKK